VYTVDRAFPVATLFLKAVEHYASERVLLVPSPTVFRKRPKTRLFSRTFPKSPGVPTQWLCQFGHYNQS